MLRKTLGFRNGLKSDGRLGSDIHRKRELGRGRRWIRDSTPQHSDDPQRHHQKPHPTLRRGLTFSMDGTLKPKEREKWARLAAHITQTINTIIDSYAENKIKKTLDQLNVEKYELTKISKISFSHPDGTHDDRFWAVAIAVYAAEQAEPPPSKPIGKVI